MGEDYSYVRPPHDHGKQSEILLAKDSDISSLGSPQSGGRATGVLQRSQLVGGRRVDSCRGRERLKIVTTVGKIYEAKPPYTVSDDGITLQISGKSMNISKSEIAQVYGVVAKPLTDFGEYSLDELGPMVIFDPDWYVHGLHLEQYVSVLFYRADDPEDNSPAQCAQR